MKSIGKEHLARSEALSRKVAIVRKIHRLRAIKCGSIRPNPASRSWLEVCVQSEENPLELWELIGFELEQADRAASNAGNDGVSAEQGIERLHDDARMISEYAEMDSYDTDEDNNEDHYEPRDYFPEISPSDEERPIDQIYCTGCGRPMVIWADEPLLNTECGRCRSGLNPEWEH